MYYFIVACLYNLTLLIGTAYLVQVHNWSPWWFALVLVLGATYGDKK